LTLGSFDEGFGNGLVMGKAFHIAGAKRTNTGLKSLISPVDNLFNGAYFSGDFGRVGTGAALSRVDYDSVCAEVMASELSFSPDSNYRFGGVFALAGVSSPERGSRFSQSAGSVFGKAVVLGSKLDLELGWTDNGGVGLSLSALSKLEGVRSIASFWSYSDGFFPLNGDGESDYRYTYIPLGESGVLHDSRGAGESGAKMKITVPVGERVSVDLDQSGWRTPSAGDWGISTKSALYFRGENNTRLRGEYSWEKRTLASGVRSKNSIRMTANIPLAKDFGLNGYLRVSRSNIGEATTDGLSANAEIQGDLFEPMQLRLQLVRSKTNIASKDNGYWALRFRNYFRTGPISWLAEVRRAFYDKADKDDLTEFRITSSYYWR